MKKRRKIILAVTAILTFIMIISVVYYTRIEMTIADLGAHPFRIGITDNIASVHPALISNDGEKMLGSMIYEGLVYYDDAAQEIKPNLAKKWKTSKDFTQYIIYVNNQIKLHNGQNITSWTVKQSWEKNLIRSNDWAAVSLYKDIQGFTERIQGQSNEITGVQVLDNERLQVVLNAPNTVFMNMLTNPIFWIFGEDETTGTGPFIVQNNPDNKNIVLARNEEYHRKKPCLSTIEMTVYNDQNQAWQDYREGRLDLITDVPLSELENNLEDENFKKRAVNKPLLTIYALGYNMAQVPFRDNYYLRRAFNYAINREEIIKKVFGDNALPLKGVIPQGIPGYDENIPGYSYNLEKAAALMSEAGYPQGEGLPTITLCFNDNSGQRMIAEMASEQLSSVGVKINLLPLDWETYKKQMQKFNMTFFRLEWQLDYNDADSIMYNLFHSSKAGMTNFNNYYNAQVDKLLNDSRGYTNKENRLSALNKAEMVVIDDAPYLWILQRKSNIMLGEDVKEFYMDGLSIIDWTKIKLHGSDAM
ncbi:MAG: ABC transporter substrate-binding protein [Syntrophomonadaceae bacterium]|nr:ABC transporter substrate-binding protein [Syntrophomonadaceae bacterium]